MKKISLGLLVLLLLLSGEVFAACNANIAVNASASGTWEASCLSVHRDGAYAKYYTFTVATSQEITIDLESGTVDTYLFLLSGSTSSGTVLDEDDDSGTGNNSQITRTLAAGTYTVEATTFPTGATGDFVVSVKTALPPAGPCNQTISTNTDVSDSWVPSCASTHRVGSYAKFFTFTLLSSQDVTIDLESTTVDTYVYLLSGSGQNGAILDQDDDSGTDTNSKITRTLAAGTYTVEATTYAAAKIGGFVVSVSTSCTDCPFVINSGLNDAWFNTATSGQGLTITVFPKIEEVFVAWFTFDTERPSGDVTAMLGEPGHRWLTAQGPYDGDTATLTIYVTEGGVFDSGQPPTSTDPDGDGTMTLEFANCNEGLVTYEITSLGISGEIPIERIVTDNVALCEALANP